MDPLNEFSYFYQVYTNPHHILGLDKPIKKNNQLEFKRFRLYFEICQLDRSRCIKPGIEAH